MSTSSTPRTGSPRQIRHHLSGGHSDDTASLVHHMSDFVQQVMQTCLAMLEFLQTQQPAGLQATNTEADVDATAAHSTAATGVADSAKNGDQIAFLKQKLKELVGMNVSWQQTHQQQERRIAELEEQVRQLLLAQQHSAADKGSSGGAYRGFSEQQQADIDRILLDQKNKYRQLEDEKCRLEEQNAKFQHDIMTLSERVQLLDVQLMTNREDFEYERKDRERAQSRVAELERALEQYRNRPSQTLPTQIMQYPASQFCGLRNNNINNDDLQWWNRPGAGRFMVDAHDGLDEADCEIDSPVVMVARGCPSPTTTTPVQHHRGGGRTTDVAEEPLQCPNCRRLFTRDQHADLMDHIDRCGADTTQ